MSLAEATEKRYELLLKRKGTPAAREEDETELELIGKPEGAEGSAQRKSWFEQWAKRCQERSDEERRLGPLSVGQRIRITGDDGLSKRALLMAFDGDDAYEVEYEAGGEAVVPAAKCSALLAFEEAGGAEADAERFKLQGNELFKLRDAAAAIEQYVLGLRALASKATPGARCLIRPPEGTGPLRSAMVLTKDANTIDVSYEADETIAQAGGKDTASRLQALLRQAETISDGSAAAASALPVPLVSAPQAAPSPPPSWLPSSSWLFSSGEEEAGALKHGGGCGGEEEEEEEEEGVNLDRVVLVVHGQQPMLQVALLLNAAKCSLLLQQGGAAIARASRAERIAAHDTFDPRTALLHRRTALVVCSCALPPHPPPSLSILFHCMSDPPPCLRVHRRFASAFTGARRSASSASVWRRAMPPGSSQRPCPTRPLRPPARSKRPRGCCATSSGASLRCVARISGWPKS